MNVSIIMVSLKMKIIMDNSGLGWNCISIRELFQGEIDAG